MIFTALLTSSYDIHASVQMGVRFWAINEYLSETEAGPSRLIDLQEIVAHAVRTEVYVRNEAMWATLRLNRVGLHCLSGDIKH